MLGTSLKFAYGFAIALAFSGLMACASRPKAPTTPSGQRLAVMVFLDRTVPPETDPAKAQQLQQVNDFLEPDLVAVLRDSGYEAASVTSVDSAGAGAPGRYTLRVRITDYNGGSMAARMAIGFGAGSARLATEFELLGPSGQSYITGAPQSSTGRTDWRRTVRKVDQEIVAAVNVRLNQGL